MPAAAALLTLALMAPATPGRVFDFDARLALGTGTRLDRTPNTDLFFELGLLFRIRLDGGNSPGLAPTLLPELSYALLWTPGTTRRDDAVVLGCGYGWTYGPLLMGFVPGVVVGSFRDRDTDAPALGGGLRLAAIVELKHFVGVQAAYQTAFRQDQFVHEVYASVSLNFMGLAVLWLAGH